MSEALMNNKIQQDNLPPISPAVKQSLLDMVKQNPYMHDMNIEILEMERGYVKSKMLVTEQILNPYGSVHGGCLYSLADITTGLASSTYNVYSSTIDGRMEYILPAMDTKYVICEGKEIHQGMHVSQYEAFLYDDKGQLVDKASFSFYMMRRRIVDSKAE